MDTLQEAVDYLKIHGGDIGKKAIEGDLLCQAIMNFYNMTYNFACNGSIGLLLDSITEYDLK